VKVGMDLTTSLFESVIVLLAYYFYFSLKYPATDANALAFWASLFGFGDESTSPALQRILDNIKRKK